MTTDFVSLNKTETYSLTVMGAWEVWNQGISRAGLPPKILSSKDSSVASLFQFLVALGISRLWWHHSNLCLCVTSLFFFFLCIRFSQISFFLLHGHLLLDLGPTRILWDDLISRSSPESHLPKFFFPSKVILIGSKGLTNVYLLDKGQGVPFNQLQPD